MCGIGQYSCGALGNILPVFKCFGSKILRTPAYIAFVGATQVFFMGIVSTFGRVAFMNGNTLTVIIHLYSNGCGFNNSMMPDMTIWNTVIAFICLKIDVSHFLEPFSFLNSIVRL